MEGPRRGYDAGNLPSYMRGVEKTILNGVKHMIDFYDNSLRSASKPTFNSAQR